MLNHPPDLTLMLLNEQLKDRERDLRSCLRRPCFKTQMVYRLGQMLIRLGSYLTRAAPCPEPSQELAWPDRN
jgi:hypothetical protein